MNPVIGAFAAFTLLLAIGTSASAENNVSEGAIREIKRQMVMPRGAPQLELYDRYYARRELQERDVIVGVFLRRDAWGGRMRDGAESVAASPNAFTTKAEQLPVIADGGCSVVTVYFDLATRRLMRIRLEGVDAEPELGACNGRA